MYKTSLSSSSNAHVEERQKKVLFSQMRQEALKTEIREESSAESLPLKDRF